AAQLNPDDRGENLVSSQVQSREDGNLQIFRVLPESDARVVEYERPLVDLFVPRDEHPAVPAGDDLEIIETVGPEIRQGSQTLPVFPIAAVRLTRILDDEQVVFFRDFQDFVHVASQT